MNEIAFRVVQQATGEVPDEEQSGKNPAPVALGRLGGLKGGKARAANLRPKQRSGIAGKAAQSRWARSRSD